MNLKEAVSRCRFTISKGYKANEKDADAFNFIMEYLSKTQEKTVQEHLLFAKLYTFVLQEFVVHYNDLDTANKKLNQLISEPFDMRIDFLLRQLKQNEVTTVFADPMLKNKDHIQLKEIFSRYPKFKDEFETCYDWWTLENVTAHLNTQITLSLQTYKNNV